MTEELKKRLESTFITRPFNIGYVPIVMWDELDSFCKKHYNDNRREMIVDLMNKEEDNIQHLLLWSEIESINLRLKELEYKYEKPNDDVNKRFKAFGGN